MKRSYINISLAVAFAFVASLLLTSSTAVAQPKDPWSIPPPPGAKTAAPPPAKTAEVPPAKTSSPPPEKKKEDKGEKKDEKEKDDSGICPTTGEPPDKEKFDGKCPTQKQLFDDMFDKKLGPIKEKAVKDAFNWWWWFHVILGVAGFAFGGYMGMWTRKRLRWFGGMRVADHNRIEAVENALAALAGNVIVQRPPAAPPAAAPAAAPALNPPPSNPALPPAASP